MKHECSHLDDESLGAYVDGELHGPAQQAAADHLTVCSACREAAATLGALGSALRQAEAPTWDAEAMIALVDAGISALETEDGAMGCAQATPLGRTVERASRALRSRRRLALRFAAAAAVAVLVFAFCVAGYVCRREMAAQDKILVDSHYVVRSGNAGALLVSYPGR